MIADKNGGSRAPLRYCTSTTVGKDSNLSAGGHGSADTVSDGCDTLALVVMSAGAQYQGVMSGFQTQSREHTRVALNSRNGETGDIRGGNFGDGLPNEFCCATPTGAES